MLILSRQSRAMTPIGKEWSCCQVFFLRRIYFQLSSRQVQKKKFACQFFGILIRQRKIIVSKSGKICSHFMSCEKKIRHLQKNIHFSDKKKLLDAKMLSLGESEWVEFDIKKAATAWLNDRKPNYGIVVEVENENEDTLDARKYFRASAPCTKSSSLSTPGG